MFLFGDLHGEYHGRKHLTVNHPLPTNAAPLPRTIATYVLLESGWASV